MKKVKVLLAVCLLIAILVIFTGCGAEIQNKISLNANGSGTRYMICTVSNSDLSRLKGGEAALDAILKQSMPGILTLNKSEFGDNTMYTFSYSFKDFNEYLSKTEKLMGRKPDSTFEITGDLFSKTLTFKETNISNDLMKWAIDAVKKSKIEGFNPGSLYNLGPTEVILDGNSQEFSSNISISTQRNFYISSVEVNTDVGSIKDFKRSIGYFFTQETDSILNMKNSELQNYFNKLVPKGGKLQKKTAGSLVDYEISFKANNIQELNSETQTASLDERAALSLNDLDNNKFSSNTREIADSIDFTKAIHNAVIKNGVKYTISVPKSYSIYKIGDNVVPQNAQAFRGENNAVLESSGNKKVIEISSQGNAVQINMEIGIPNSNPYILKTLLIILVLVVIAFFFVKFLGKRFKYNGGFKEDTLKFDPDWRSRINSITGKNNK